MADAPARGCCDWSRRHYVDHIPQEAAQESEGPNKLPASWPDAGRIEFKNLQMRYRQDTPLVLKGITATIEPAQRVGIVGRTGSGKSSLLLCLLRIVEPHREPDDKSGSIFIDGIDICTIGLSELRRKVAIIPQSPSKCPAVPRELCRPSA